jgi:tight adherence protein C
MTLSGFTFDPASLPPGWIIWPLVFGLGAYMVLTAQPIGRPKPDLAELLRRLDVDEVIKDEVNRQTSKPIFASPLLERILRPALEDVGQTLRRLLGALGLTGSQDLEQRLRRAGAGLEPAQFYGEKVALGLIGLGVFPLTDALGVSPVGTWPLWTWIVGFIAGFLAPDWNLNRRLAERRARVLMELPVICDMLTICTSAGLALEQALNVIARQSAGAMARELQHVSREVALGQRSLLDALGAMAQRNGVPELTRFVSQLQAAHEQGVPIVQALSAQADALREEKRMRIVAEGGRSAVRMLLPVAAFILPVYFVILLGPAVLQVVHLGG